MRDRPRPSLSPAEEERIRRYLDAAEKVARSIGRKSEHLVSSVDAEDLVSVAKEALVVAARRYDPEQGASFWTFARPRVAGAVMDVLRKQNRGVRQHRRALRRLEQEQRALDALTATASEALRQDAKARVDAAARLVQATVAGIVARRTAAYEEEQLPADETNPEAATIRKAMLAHLRDALERLSPEERALYEALYVEGATASEVGQRLGVHASTISRRHARLLERLGRALSGEGDARPHRASRA
ncbi:MAG: sigma-70 family RNA polymerase sigma factor [Deltaproteobacteria bacterium]|nr:MAG: sigma-70 family RNA polymerase sigma factor [Deltaproteobacteria bacterium]